MQIEETICMKFQVLFSWKTKNIFQNVVCWLFYLACKKLNNSEFRKNNINCHLLKIQPYKLYRSKLIFKAAKPLKYNIL